MLCFVIMRGLMDTRRWLTRGDGNSSSEDEGVIGSPVVCDAGLEEVEMDREGVGDSEPVRHESEEGVGSGG